jgi:hypothetical protein
MLDEAPLLSPTLRKKLAISVWQNHKQAKASSRYAWFMMDCKRAEEEEESHATARGVNCRIYRTGGIRSDERTSAM